jgi:hypothetical protein
LRLVAQGLHHARNEFGDFYRRMRAKLGGVTALVATAQKLARIVYALITPNSTPGPNNAASSASSSNSVPTRKNSASNSRQFNKLRDVFERMKHVISYRHAIGIEPGSIMHEREVYV